jgi:hypothetical protein
LLDDLGLQGVLAFDYLLLLVFLDCNLAVFCDEASEAEGLL